MEKEIKYFVFLLQYFFIYLFVVYVSDYYWLRRLDALVVFSLLSLIGLSPGIEGTNIAGFEVIKECAGIQAIGILVGLAVLSKMSLRKKLLAVLWIFSAVTFMDVFRIFIQIVLDYYKLVSWQFNHGILTWVFSVPGVLVLILFLARAFPEFKESVIYLFSFGRKI